MKVLVAPTVPDLERKAILELSDVLVNDLDNEDMDHYATVFCIRRALLKVC